MRERVDVSCVIQFCCLLHASAYQNAVSPGSRGVALQRKHVFTRHMALSASLCVQATVDDLKNAFAKDKPKYYQSAAAVHDAAHR